VKRVLILVNHEVVIYNFRKELVERLLQDGFQVYISCPYGERIEELKEMGCNFVDTSISRHGTNPVEDLKLTINYIQMMKHIKPDVVLTYTIKPNIYGGMACRMLKIPYIANITGLGSAVENGGLMQKITVMLYKIAFKKINCLFFQNEENRSFFVKKNIAVNRHKLIPGSGVNLEHFKVLDYPADSTIEFVFISRIMKEKGIDQYLEAAEYVRGKYPNTRFHILGFCEEAYEEKLKELEAKGIVQYHGMQKDIRLFLKTTHCTIHPTYYPEGMSNVLLESAASGRPVITTNRSGCRETVEDGLTGFIVEQRNSADLIEKIERFIKQSHEKKRNMGLAGRQKIEKEFDRQIVVDAYITEIITVLKKRS